MAEVIGVVSGALTFATVAAQVTKSIIQIKDCWGQIRDAPEDLQQLVKEVEIFGLILADIEADISQDLVASALKNSNHASQSLELCKQAANDLEAVSTSLTNNISNIKGLKRTYTSVKMVIKKGNVEKYRSRLGSATRLLSLSQQCYTRALLQVQPELIAARIIGNGENEAGQQMTQDNETDNDMNTITKRRYKSNPRYSQTQDYLWRLVLPPWLVGKCFEVAGRRAPSGWQWSFKTYNIVPVDSASFSLVRKNDVEGLQRLFSSGQASPFELITSRSSPAESTTSLWTLVQWAILYNNVETVNFLINQGADVEGWSGRVWIWFGMFRLMLSQFRHYPRSPLLRALMEHDDELCAMEDDRAWDTLMLCSHYSAEEFRLLQQNICPSFYDAPQWRRNSVLMAYFDDLIPRDFVLADPHAVVCIILRGVPFTAGPREFESYSKFLASYGLQEFPKRIARHNGFFLGFKRLGFSPIDEFNKAQKSLCNILNDFLVGGFDINEVDDASSHLLIAFFEGYLNRLYPSFKNKSLNDEFRFWLKELQNLGVNLKSFGKSGERSFKLSGGPREYDCDHDYYYESVTIRLLGFSHGSSPEDWKLWVSEPSDTFSGDFWRMIERRMEIPGGWSSDIHLFLQ